MATHTGFLVVPQSIIVELFGSPTDQFNLDLSLLILSFKPVHCYCGPLRLTHMHEESRPPFCFSDDAKDFTTPS